MTTQDETKANPEQLLYAGLLEKGMMLGLVLMFITFALYVFGIMKPAIPLNEIANYWSTPVHDYLVNIDSNFLHRDGNLITGWKWVSLVGFGDFLNFIPVAILSGITILCYGAIVPMLFAKGDKAYAFMAIAEVVILAGAASGLLAVGH